MKLKKGFTLIEVIVVIGIVGVLTVIVFPAINNIRAKNRDTERVADIATIQLGLLYYYNQATSSAGYPSTLSELITKYVPAEALVSPDGRSYTYVPLTRNSSGVKPCTYYQLGVTLESQSTQIDKADTFNTTANPNTNGYYWCDYGGPGLSTGGTNYNVHP